MNWTEGALARHSRRKGWDKDAARQKEYFAKARARKNEVTGKRKLDPSSFIPDYIPRPEDHPHTPPTTRKKPNGSRKRLIYQKNDRDGRASSASSRSSGLRSGRSTRNSHEERRQSRRHESIDSKRRKLLEKTDWTGINFQKPIVVDFSWQKSHGPKHSLTQQLASNTNRHLVEDLSRKERHHKNRMGNTPDRGYGDSMRIQIGGHDLRWSRASNSIRSPVSHRSRLPAIESRKPRLGDHSSPSMSSNSPSRISNILTADQDHMPSPEARTSTLKARISANTDPDVTQDALQRYHDRKKRRKVSDKPKFIVRSSPSIIHHPQPTRETRLSFLPSQSPDSEAAESTRAQVGQPDRDLNRTTRDDHKWNLWLNPPNVVEDEALITRGEGAASQRSISPGISHYWECSKSQSQSSFEDMINEEAVQQRSNSAIVISSGSSSSSSDGLDLEDAVPNSSVQETGEIRVTKPGSREEEPQPGPVAIQKLHQSEESPTIGRDLIIPSATQLPKAPNVQDLMDLLIEEEREEAEPRNPAREPTPEDEDEDEIWKRFVFDDDISEIKRKAHDEARQQTTRNLRQTTTDVASDLAEPPSIIWNEPSSSPKAMLSSCRQFPLVHTDELLTSSEAPTTESTNSIIAHVGSPQPQSDFRFHHPRLFVGRLASGPLPDLTPNPPPLQPLKRGRGRPRKRRDISRPDFRAMPNFDGDPIEEG